MKIYLVIGNDKNVAAFNTKEIAENFIKRMKEEKRPDHYPYGNFQWVIWKIEELELVLESDND